MQDDPVAVAAGALDAAVTGLRAESRTATAQARIGVLQQCQRVTRQVEQLSITLIAGLERDGAFDGRGYPRPAQAVADLLGCDTAQASRWVRVAQQLTERVGCDGQLVPPRLSGTAAALATGRIGLRHAETIAAALGSAPDGAPIDPLR